ncbi:MAG: DNA repair protein RecO, partial [Mycobacteriales bacterium]
RLTVEEREPALRLYLLLAGALRVLAAGTHPAGLVLDAFLVRALGLAGYAPSFQICAQCGAPGPHRYFAPPTGGSVCRDCRPPGAAGASAAALELLGALRDGDWAAAEASAYGTRREAAGLLAAYLQWHLERSLRSLPLVERG